MHRKNVEVAELSIHIVLNFKREFPMLHFNKISCGGAILYGSQAWPSSVLETFLITKKKKKEKWDFNFFVTRALTSLCHWCPCALKLVTESKF